MQRLIHLDIARALAILLITNSHLRLIYPMESLAFGGMVGNCLFFIVAGQLFTHPQGWKSFFPWFRRRIKRVYAPLMLVTAALFLIGANGPLTPLNVISQFLIPLDYWFLPTIVAFYCLTYAADSVANTVTRKVALAIALCIIYLTHHFITVDRSAWNIETTVSSKVPFYFLVFYVSTLKWNVLNSFDTYSYVLISIATAMVYVVLTMYMKHGGHYQYQFLVQVAGFIAAMSVVICLAKPTVSTRVVRLFDPVVTYLSSRSLQIYIVQVPIVTNELFTDHPTFPANFVLFMFTLAIGAEILYRLRPERWTSFVSERTSSKGVERY
jgi:hypothetical protein